VASLTHECLQGDPNCDTDGNTGTCTFQVATCFRVPDPRLIPACALEDVASYRLKKPSLKRDPATAGALIAALDALPGSTVEPKRGRDVTFEPPLNAVQCTTQVSVVVPVGKQQILRGQTRTASGVKDNDSSLRLKCMAP